MPSSACAGTSAGDSSVISCACRCAGASQHVSAAHIEAHAVLTDSLLNHETVKYFDTEAVVCDRYDLALSRTESAWRRFFHSYAANGLIVATIFALSLGASLTYAARGVGSGVMTVGDFVLVNAYVVRLVQPLEMLGFAVRPRIFVFDEATSSLDSRTEREILRNLVDLASRSTTLVIPHRLSTVVHADEILVLDRGAIVERGTHDQLRVRDGYYASLWNAQQADARKSSRPDPSRRRVAGREP